jgi:hypothetical protein
MQRINLQQIPDEELPEIDEVSDDTIRKYLSLERASSSIFDLIAQWSEGEGER